MSGVARKARAPRNRTVEVHDREAIGLRARIVRADAGTDIIGKKNVVICGDAFEVLKRLPKASFDLIFADPPYNLTKKFGLVGFRELSLERYEDWIDSWLKLCVPLLAPTASVYICGDWRSSSTIQRAGSRYLKLRNRITWEREKGRGARSNWKNTAEDIWFFTVSDEYIFDLRSVKLRRNVIAPYRKNGEPKDWDSSAEGNFRDTHPSNIWTDISVPFWSMPENTDHPTQKSEKLLAKIILASTKAGGLILDPFAGSGTAAAAAKKLGRDFVVIESDENYCMLAQKRLDMAENDPSIQGFSDGVFWERNSGHNRVRG
jgi:site-specific DNA-methyltransferase (adenine-specific)